MNTRIEKTHILNDALSPSFMTTLCGMGFDILRNISKDQALKNPHSNLCGACMRGIGARSKPGINYIKGKKWKLC